MTRAEAVRIEPDPCIPITNGGYGYPDRVKHRRLTGDKGFVGAEVSLWHGGLRIGRYVYPREDLRPDGLRILKGF